MIGTSSDMTSLVSIQLAEKEEELASISGITDQSKIPSSDLESTGSIQFSGGGR